MAMQVTEAECVARLFHETYETLAPEHGYITRRESRTDWDRVPPHNRDLMIAVAQKLLDDGVISVRIPEGVSA